MISTPAEAAQARRHLTNQLRASEEAGAAALAAILSRCTGSAPCRSAACPFCALAFQHAAEAIVEEHIRTPARAIRNRMTALTIVPASGCFALDELSAAACDRVADEIMAALATLCLPPTAVGIEVSANEDMTGEVEPHWSAHGHLISLGWLSGSEKAGLRAHFPASRLVKRPIHCVPLDQRREGRRYPWKVDHVRRVTEIRNDDPERGPYRSTRHRALRPHQAVSLALVEHRRGFGGRLLIHGIDEGAVRGRLRGFRWARDGP